MWKEVEDVEDLSSWKKLLKDGRRLPGICLTEEDKQQTELFYGLFSTTTQVSWQRMNPGELAPDEHR